jgi:hypothetical protein
MIRAQQLLRCAFTVALRGTSASENKNFFPCQQQRFQFFRDPRCAFVSSNAQQQPKLRRVESLAP